jgi:hypothetical protein
MTCENQANERPCQQNTSFHNQSIRSRGLFGDISLFVLNSSKNSSFLQQKQHSSWESWFKREQFLIITDYRTSWNQKWNQDIWWLYHNQFDRKHCQICRPNNICHRLFRAYGPSSLNPKWHLAISAGTCLIFDCLVPWKKKQAIINSLSFNFNERCLTSHRQRNEWRTRFVCEIAISCEQNSPNCRLIVQFRMLHFLSLQAISEKPR